jgi:hypothetical protein
VGQEKVRAAHCQPLFCGLGTAFVGQRDFWPDGSYVTTEWTVILLVPLVPLGSLRLRKNVRKFPEPLETSVRYPFISREQRYAVFDETPRCGKQVACGYAFIASYAAWVLGLLRILTWILPRFSGFLGAVVAGTAALVIFGLPWILPLYLRERAMHWRPGFK